jgi:hypothetical protein
MAALAPLIGQFLGVETKSIHYQMSGKSRSVSIPGVLDQAIEGVSNPTNPDEVLCIDNTMHPANRRLALTGTIDKEARSKILTIRDVLPKALWQNSV